MALAGVAQLVGHPPANQKVVGSVPNQGTCRRQPTAVSLSHWYFSPSFSCSLPLSVESLKKKKKRTNDTYAGVYMPWFLQQS